MLLEAMLVCNMTNRQFKAYFGDSDYVRVEQSNLAWRAHVGGGCTWAQRDHTQRWQLQRNSLELTVIMTAAATVKHSHKLYDQDWACASQKLKMAMQTAP